MAVIEPMIVPGTIKRWVLEVAGRAPSPDCYGLDAFTARRRHIPPLPNGNYAAVWQRIWYHGAEFGETQAIKHLKPRSLGQPNGFRKFGIMARQRGEKEVAADMVLIRRG